MEEFIDKIIANGLQDLKGLAIDCEIPLTEPVLTGFIMEYLSDTGREKAGKEAGEKYLRLFKKHLKDIEIKLKDGKAVVHISIYVE